LKKLLITGSSGFVGKNLIDYFKNDYKIFNYSRIENTYHNNDITIHLAGIAHDLTNKYNDQDYFESNVNLTINLFDKFLESDSKVFIYFSSIKAVAEFSNTEINENTIANPKSIYGKTKKIAEDYIINKRHLYKDKKVYILRPAMIHGIGNKGNFNLLFNYIKLNIPWIFQSFNNARNYCYIENLLFIINKIIINYNNVVSGIYNICDTDSISTNQIVQIIENLQRKKVLKIKVPILIILFFAKIGSFLNLFFNIDRLNKITGNFLINNNKILKVLNTELPYNAKDGLKKTFKSFL